jgi:hypothetical protein
MKKWAFWLIIFVLSIFLTIPGAWCKEKIKTPSKSQPPSSEGRALSLRVLQERLTACQGKGSCPLELTQLAGINRVYGYVVDEVNHDIILIGRVDNRLPHIYLEDFIVALRNAWLKYAVLKGNTYYYSNPSCSIDPNPEVIQKLQAIGGKILGNPSTSDMEKGIEAWHKICRFPQKVRVMGIPFDTHFAWVMVKADYDMKRLVAGSDSLSIPGLISLSDMTLSKIKSDIVQGRPTSIPLSTMNRFWFHPGENSYKENKGIVIIKNCQVTLLTEEEYLHKSGKIAGKGRPNTMAQEFASNFTARYAKIAKQRPIYAELENLFRFVALGKIINFKSPQKEAALDLGYLLNHCPIPKKSVSRHLEGRSNVKHFEHRQDLQGGYKIIQLWLPSCGGVSIEIEISQKDFVKDTTGKLSELRAIVLNDRPTPDALFWDYPRKKVGVKS